MSSNGLPFSESRKKWNEYEKDKIEGSKVHNYFESRCLRDNPCGLHSHYWVAYYDGEVSCKHCGWILCL